MTSLQTTGRRAGQTGKASLTPCLIDEKTETRGTGGSFPEPMAVMEPEANETLLH